MEEEVVRIGVEQQRFTTGKLVILTEPLVMAMINFFLEIWIFREAINSKFKFFQYTECCRTTISATVGIQLVFSSFQNTYQSKNFSFLSADGTITGLSSNVNDSFEIDSNAFSYYVGHWYGDWSVSHDGSGNFSLNYVAVPEPSTYAMVFSLFGFIYLSTKPGNLLSGFFLTVARRKKAKGLSSNEL